ncbi:MAG: hypothetical protein JW700_01320 [Candidatus Aenigmarchaeota archaeon]|nr:hypothetical protein [Candidatus Aenigmarchaeota archaeon]
MKIKKDCKECGVPLKDWQAKQDYDLCLECYNEKQIEKKKSTHEVLGEMASEEENEKMLEDESERDTQTEDEVDKGVEEIDDEDLGYGSGHLEEDLQGEEDED